MQTYASGSLSERPHSLGSSPFPPGAPTPGSLSDDYIRIIKFECLEGHPALCHRDTSSFTTSMLKRVDVVGQASDISIVEQRQEDSCKFKASQVYTESSRKWTDNKSLFQKKKKKNPNTNNRNAH